jgi:hypothetical protein
MFLLVIKNKKPLVYIFRSHLLVGTVLVVGHKELFFVQSVRSLKNKKLLVGHEYEPFSLTVAVVVVCVLVILSDL